MLCIVVLRFISSAKVCSNISCSYSIFCIRQQHHAMERSLSLEERSSACYVDVLGALMTRLMTSILSQTIQVQTRIFRFQPVESDHEMKLEDMAVCFEKGNLALEY